VFNYDFPETHDDFVHRAGRTGRAGAEGISSSFVSGTQLRDLQRLERELGLSVKRVKAHGLTLRGSDRVAARGPASLPASDSRPPSPRPTPEARGGRPTGGPGRSPAKGGPATSPAAPSAPTERAARTPSPTPPPQSRIRRHPSPNGRRRRHAAYLGRCRLPAIPRAAIRGGRAFCRAGNAGACASASLGAAERAPAPVNVRPLRPAPASPPPAAMR